MATSTCELIMLNRDTCGMPAEKCPKCEKWFCPQCFPEHNKVHEPLLPEPRKLEVSLGICKICGLVAAYADRGCSGCGGETEPLKVELKADDTIIFYTEDPFNSEKRPLLDDTTDM